MRKTGFLFALCALCAAWPSAGASRSYGLTLAAGRGAGTFWLDTGIVCVRSPCPSFLESENGPVLTAILDYAIGRRLDLEVLAGSQESGLSHRDSLPPANAVDLPAVDLDIGVFEVGLRRRWERARHEPFAAFGVGIARLRSGPVVGTRLGDDRSSLSLGVGTRIALGERIGLRLELRGRQIDLPPVFSAPGGAAVRVVGGDLDQWHSLVGLSWRR